MCTCSSKLVDSVGEYIGSVHGFKKTNAMNRYIPYRMRRQEYYMLLMCQDKLVLHVIMAPLNYVHSVVGYQVIARCVFTYM